MQKYWCVASKVHNDGHITANIVDVKEADECPRDSMKSLPSGDVYIDWFTSQSDAEKHVRDARNA